MVQLNVISNIHYILCFFSVTSTSTTTTPVTTAAPTSSTKGTGIWDKAIDYVTPLGTFIIVIVAVALLLILLVVQICICVSS